MFHSLLQSLMIKSTEYIYYYTVRLLYSFVFLIFAKNVFKYLLAFFQFVRVKRKEESFFFHFPT